MWMSEIKRWVKAAPTHDLLFNQAGSEALFSGHQKALHRCYLEAC